MLKAKLSVLLCPECGELMMVHDIHDTKLSVGKCGGCGKEYEIRDLGKGLEPIIKPKKVN